MKSYPSHFGPLYIGDDLAQLSSLIAELSPSKIFIIADTNTARDCVPWLTHEIPDHQLFILPTGESNKNLEHCEACWSFLLENGADRKSIVINVGGGVVCDLGGFVASCFQRGLRFIHIPTSVLAMTDASIGGKLGVNFKGHKNYIGLFQHPQLIWVHLAFLQTLPEREKIDGLAEIVKHAIIGSAELLDELEKINHPADIHWSSLLPLSIAVKIKIVDVDPYEKNIRKTLNFGHTIGHALESYFLETADILTHGQAITYGMLAETKMAHTAGILAERDFERIVSLIQKLLQPKPLHIPDLSDLMKWLTRDKKNEHNQLSFSLPDGIGSCLWNETDSDPEPALQWLQEQVSGKSFRLMSDPF